MSNEPLSKSQDDPLQVLGLPRHASEAEVRARYLELLREYPPERDPSRFQQIHAAYKAASDPLVLAKQLLTANEDEPKAWDVILSEQRAQPPRLSIDVLLSLGNRPSTSPPTSNLSGSSVTPHE
jgi:hypothetical protein